MNNKYAKRVTFSFLAITLWAQAITSHAVLAAPAPTAPLSPACTETGPIQPSFFGLNGCWYRAGDSNSRSLPTSGFPYGVWRLNGEGVTWADIETTQGQYDWSMLDGQVNYAWTRGIKMMYTVQGTPSFYVTSPNATAFYCSYFGNTLPPSGTTGFQAYQNFVNALATRYKGKIQYYEGWNEASTHWNGQAVANFSPSQVGFYSGTPQQLLTLQQVLYQTVKKVDPNCSVISPSFTNGYNGLAALDTFLALGAGNYFDIAGFHFYTNTAQQPNVSSAPDTMEPIIYNLKATLTKYNKNCPIWNTETGWFSTQPWNDSTAAGYVARGYLVAALEGLQSFEHFTWNEPATRGSQYWVQINTPQATSEVLTIAGRAYLVVRNWLLGATVGQTHSTSTVCWLELKHTYGPSQWVVWSADDQSRPFTIPTGWNISNEQLLSGTWLPVKTPTVTIGAAPVLLSYPPAG